jgi:hypothetical protein
LCGQSNKAAAVKGIIAAENFRGRQVPRDATASPPSQVPIPRAKREGSKNSGAEGKNRGAVTARTSRLDPPKRVA